MISFEDSNFKDLILYKLDLHFGVFFLCEDYIISEVKEGIVFSSEHAEEFRITALPYYEKLGMVKKRPYIANRIHHYSVKPVDWLFYGAAKKYLSSYCVVDLSPTGILNALLESKFVPLIFKSVVTMEDALEWSSKFIVQEHSLRY